MGFWTDFINIFKRSAEADPTPAGSESPLSPRMGGDYTDFFTWSGTTNTALSVATAYRCVKFLSEGVANLPMLYMRIKDGILVEDTNSRLHYLL